MTLQQIIAAGWGARELYDRMRILEIKDSVKEPLTIAELSKKNCDINGTKVPYSVCLCRVCIDRIISKYNRKETMMNDDRWALANMMEREFGHWKVTELKTFAYMLLANRLPTYGYGGVTETDIKLFDISSFMKKMRAYEAKRPDQTPEGEINAAKSMEELRLEKIMKGRKSPYNCYGDWQRTHDPEGREIAGNWDFERCWNDWFNTHYVESVSTPSPCGDSPYSSGRVKRRLSLADQIWERCTKHVPRNKDAYAYWKSIPSSEEVSEMVGRMLERLKKSTLGFDVNSLVAGARKTEEDLG